MISSVIRFLVVLSALGLTCADCARAQPNTQETNPNSTSITVTGLLLASDWQCDTRPKNVPKDELACPEGYSQWGLLTLTKQYSLVGNTSDLKRYERRRVAVTGTVSPGKQSFRDKLDVESIRPGEISATEIMLLIEQLRNDGWTQPMNISNPTLWMFRFTSPMLQILQAGPVAQDVLLEYVNDPQIKDHIIILLGGVGDAKAVGPIISAMADRDEAASSAYAKKVNLAANLALTNITVADVIWHHGGGITIDRCPQDPKSCWVEWWSKHEQDFDVSKTVSRRYSNYPDYGIYQDPSTFRSESLMH